MGDMDKAMTAIARKAALKTIDVDSNGCMSAIEYFVWKFEKDVTETVDSPQGTSEELVEALYEEERIYNEKIADAERRSGEGGVVSRNKAKNELEQLKAEDPLPLRRAKITQEAAIKKSEKTKKAAEETLADCQEKFKEAQAYLTKVKASCGSAQGGIWWIERELHEAKKYMPTAKGGISRK